MFVIGDRLVLVLDDITHVRGQIVTRHVTRMYATLERRHLNAVASKFHQIKITMEKTLIDTGDKTATVLAFSDKCFGIIDD